LQLEAQAALKQRLAALDRAIGKMYAALPRNGLLVVATGQGDTAEMRRQFELKAKRQQGVPGLSPWTTADEERFCEWTEGTLKALAFAAVKGEE
jgi:hypothetical protein